MSLAGDDTLNILEVNAPSGHSLVDHQVFGGTEPHPLPGVSGNSTARWSMTDSYSGLRTSHQVLSGTGEVPTPPRRARSPVRFPGKAVHEAPVPNQHCGPAEGWNGVKLAFTGARDTLDPSSALSDQGKSNCQLVVSQEGLRNAHTKRQLDHLTI